MMKYITFIAMLCVTGSPIAYANGSICAAVLAGEESHSEARGDAAAPDARRAMTPKEATELYRGFIAKHPDEAQALASRLVGSGAILGTVHLSALKAALADMGLTTNKNPEATATLVAFKALRKLYKGEGDGELKFRIAEKTLARIIEITRSEDAGLDPVTREVKAMETSKELKASARQILKSHDLLKELVSSDEKRAFVLSLIQETNPMAVRMVIGDNSNGKATVVGVGSLFGVFATPLSILAATHGMQWELALTSAFSMLGTFVGTVSYGPQFLSAPADMVRRAVAKWRVKKVIKNTRGEVMAEGLTALPLAEQAALIKEAEHGADAEFHRAVFLSAAREVGDLSAAELVTYGRDMLQGVLTIPDRQAALAERRGILLEQLSALQKSVSAAKDRGEVAQTLKKAMENAEGSLGSLLTDAMEFSSDLEFAKRGVNDHQVKLNSGVADKSKEVYLHLLRADFENAQALVEKVSVANQEFITALGTELSSIRQAKMQLADAAASKATRGTQAQAGSIDGVLAGLLKQAKK
jgi:hypothetical protein